MAIDLVEGLRAIYVPTLASDRRGNTRTTALSRLHLVIGVAVRLASAKSVSLAATA